MSQQYPPDNSNQPWNNPQQQPYPPQGPYGQPPTQYPQQGYNPQPYYPQQPPMYQQPVYPQQHPGYQQPQQPQKKQRPTIGETWRSGPAGKFGVIATIVIALLVCGTCSGIMHAATSTGSPVATPTQTAAQVVPANKKAPTVKPAPTTKPKPTAKPVPTQSPAQVEAAYKTSTTDTTVASMDKDGNADSGNDEHFTATLVAFVKDSGGNTAGANVTDGSGAFVQIIFTPGTDITQLNAQDSIEVWGTNQGVSSGTNAFGATVQEVVVQANYMNDTTTGYKSDF